MKKQLPYEEMINYPNLFDEFKENLERNCCGWSLPKAVAQRCFIKKVFLRNS